MLNMEYYKQHSQLLCRKLSPLHKMKRKNSLRLHKKATVKKQQLLFPIAAMLEDNQTGLSSSTKEQGKSALC